MAITAECTSCGKKFQAPPQFAGKRVKCKGCGTVFQIPGEVATPKPKKATAGGGPGGKGGSTTGGAPSLHASDSSSVEMDANDLSQLESLASFSGEDAEDPGDSPRRIGPRLETRMAANPNAEEIPLDVPSQAFGRRNLMHFRYPGAKSVDQWLPLGLIVLGFGGFGFAASQQDVQNISWIGLLRFLIPVLLYYAFVFPITLSMIRKAGREMHYQMPPNLKLRTFATFMPAFAMSTSMWFFGNGALFGLIVGAVVGLVISGSALWLLFRLREAELPGSIAYGAGGFAIGAVISIALVMGLNLLAQAVVSQAKADARVPLSPFGPGLSWIAPPAPARTPLVNTKPRAALVQVTASSAPPAAPVEPENSIVAPLETNKIPGPFDEILRPTSSTPIVGIVRKKGGSCTVEAWNTQTWEQQGDALSLSTVPDKFVISTDGQEVAYLAKWPRKSIAVWSFDKNRLIAHIDLDEGESRLLAFSSPDRVLLQRGEAASGMGIEAYSVASEALVITPFRVPPSTGGAAIAISPATQRLLAAGKRDGSPILVQYDLITGKELSAIPVKEIDHSLPFEPRGLAYSTLGKLIAVYIEDKESRSGMLLSYEADTGKKLKEVDWPTPLLPTSNLDKFGATENAIAWLDPLPCWLLFGRVLVDARSGDVLTDLKFDNVIAQRVTDKDRLELLVAPGAGTQIAATSFDRAKIKPLLAPANPDASEGPPAGQAPPAGITSPAGVTPPAGTPPASIPPTKAPSTKPLAPQNIFDN